jgi:hypothetical protein
MTGTGHHAQLLMVEMGSCVLAWASFELWSSQVARFTGVSHQAWQILPILNTLAWMCHRMAEVIYNT